MKLNQRSTIMKISAAITAIIAIVAITFMNISAAEERRLLNENPQVSHISQDELITRLKDKEFADKYVLLDVRTPLEYGFGHIEGAVNIPHYDILDDVSLLDEYNGKELIMYCQSGVRVGKVTRLLTKLKYQNLSHLEGDIKAWKANDLPLE